VSDQTQPGVWLESAVGERTLIQGTCYIGRSPSNHLVLSEEKVSRRHAMIHAQGAGEFWLVDLGSSNGTYLNGRRVSQPCQLADQDRLDFGTCSFLFRHPKLTRPSETVMTDTEKTIQDIRSMESWLLVADIEGSTQFVQKLPPEEASMVTGRWLAECKKIVENHQGTINKFLGDGFFAYWHEEADAADAVGKALKALTKLQAKESPRFRIVLHFGKVFVGGAASMGEESLLGSEVNFVFRMEKLAGSLGAPCLLSTEAHRRIGSQLPAMEESRRPVPGFAGEFSFFQPAGIPG
jgi:adenylate cyclase